LQQIILTCCILALGKEVRNVFEDRTSDNGEGQRPTAQRWQELLEQIVEQIAEADLKLRDAEWISTHQVTDFECLMLMKAARVLVDLQSRLMDQTIEQLGKRPERHILTTVIKEQINDPENLRTLGLSLDQIAGEVDEQERRRAILTKMAEALRNGSDPFEESWLAQHGIGEPERHELYQIVGGALYGYQACHPFVRAAIHKGAKLYLDSPDPDSWLQREYIAKVTLDDLRSVLK
jgi:hypothetical protein